MKKTPIHALKLLNKLFETQVYPVKSIGGITLGYRLMVTREEYNTSWIAKWPGYCKKCLGWGGGTFYEHHDEGGPEQLLDPCDREPYTTCHRCGVPGTLSVDGEGPCKNCGWNYDDGLLEEDPKEM